MAPRKKLQVVGGAPGEAGSTSSPIASPLYGDNDQPLQALAVGIDGAPGPKGLKVPAGYSITAETGVCAVKMTQERDEFGTLLSTQPQYKQVCAAPVIITARMVDVDTGEEFIELKWKWPDQGWRSAIVDRQVVCETSKAYALSKHGFPIHGDNAKEIIRYLHCFEDANRKEIRSQKITSHLGWQGKDGELGFMLGARLITDATDLDRLETLDLLGEEVPQDVVFHSQHAGMADIADAYGVAGSADLWVDVVKELQQYPIVMAGIYASFVPPLLQFLEGPNFTIDFAGTTTIGKTTVERACASVWGNPDEKSSKPSLIKGWDSTRVFIERLSVANSGLPMFLDDTACRKKKEEIPDILYDVAKGMGKGRGTVQAVASVGRFRTVLFSTGEYAASDIDQKGGSRVRVVEVTHPPFSPQTPKTRETVMRVNTELCRNYGHAGRAFVQQLAATHTALSGSWRAHYEGKRNELAKGASTDVEGRMLAYVALVETAAWLVHSLLQWPWDYHEAIGALRWAVAEQASDAPPHVRAMRFLASWTAAHEAGFWGKHRTSRAIGLDDGAPIAPAGGWLGRWDKDGDVVAYYPHVLERALEEGAFLGSRSIIGEWVRLGWVQVGDGGRPDAKMQIETQEGKQTRRLVRVFRANLFE